jgi:hypothetical protein
VPLVPYDRTWVHPSQRLRPFYRSWEDACLWPHPLAGWTPTRTVTFSTKAGLDSAKAGLQDGDYIVYNGTGVLTISSSTSNGYAIQNKSVATKAVFDFGNYYSANHVKFQTTSSSFFYGLYIEKATNLCFIGGEYTSATDYGILFQGGSNCVVWDAVMPSCGAGGLFCTTEAGPANVTNSVFKWESFDSNQNPTGDPHGTLGGGWHEGQISDGGIASSLFNNNVFMVYGHDSDIGSCIQFGDTNTTPSLNNNQFFIKSEHNHYTNNGADSAGYGFVVWGSAKQSNNVCRLLQVKDHTGRATFCNSLTTTSTNCMVVEHGRAINTNQDTTDLAAHDSGLGVTVPYDTRKPTKMTYQDCI